MVLVYGPMMSLDASGSLADTITFSKWKGRNYVRERVIPSNPKSGAQVGRRAMFKFLSQDWTNLSVSDKATYQDLADQIVASPFNAFVQSNMRNWHNFLAASMPYPATREDAVGAVGPGLVVSWVENRIRITCDLATANANWNLMLFASATGTFDTDVANCIQVNVFSVVQQYMWYWTPPSVQEWFFDARLGSEHGTLGAELGEQSAAP